MTESEDRIERQIIQPMCKLAIEVAIRRFEFPTVACDCFCATGPARAGENWSFEHEWQITDYIQAAVRRCLAEDAEARMLTAEEERKLSR